MKSPWPTKKLGEICDFIFGFSFRADDFNDKGLGMPVIRTGDLNNLRNTEKFYTGPYKDEYLVESGDVLIGLSGTIISGIWQGPRALLNQRVVKLTNFRNVEKKFIGYILPLPLKKLDEELTKSAVKNVLKNHLANLEIPLPSLHIQHKIVKILDTIQEAIEIQEKIIEKTKELKKSLMAELFKYGGPSFRKVRKLKKTEIGEIPEDWKVVRLGEVTSQIIDTPHKIPPKTSFGIPFISVNYMLNFPDTNFYIDKAKEGLEYVDLNEAREFLKRFIPEKNDILFSKWGTPGVAKLINTSEKFLGSCSLALIKPLTLKVNPFYLVYLLNSPIVRKQVDLLSPTSTRTEIHIGHIEKLKIPRPPLPEQQEIAEILQTIDQKIEIEKKKKELYEELFRTMLNKIMSREIDVEKINLE
jgi:type I restriction enzyme S subunit